MEDRLLIHIGYPKTATTWLQNHLFTKEQGFVAPWPTAANRIVEDLVWPREAAFDASAVAAGFWRDAAEAGAADAVPVISHEALIGDPVRGLYWGDAVARRLADAFPSAHILISIREQSALSYSAWGEYVRRGGQLSLGQYLFRTGRDEAGYRPFLPPEYLDFEATFTLYAALFGAERVTVLPLELLKNDQDAYARAVLSPLGTRPAPIGHGRASYPSLPRVALESQRVMNRAIAMDTMTGPVPGLARKLSARIGRYARKYGLPDDRDAAIAEIRTRRGKIFADSNRRLQAHLETDLGALGYCL